MLNNFQMHSLPVTNYHVPNYPELALAPKHRFHLAVKLLCIDVAATKELLDIIYIIWGFLSVTKNCHGDEGCPRADCVDGVDSVVTMVCVMYDVYSD